MNNVDNVSFFKDVPCFWHKCQTEKPIKRQKEPLNRSKLKKVWILECSRSTSSFDQQLHHFKLLRHAKTESTNYEKCLSSTDSRHLMKLVKFALRRNNWINIRRSNFRSKAKLFSKLPNLSKDMKNNELCKGPQRRLWATISRLTPCLEKLL